MLLLKVHSWLVPGSDPDPDPENVTGRALVLIFQCTLGISNSKPKTNHNEKTKSSGFHPAGGLNPDPDPENGSELLRVNGEAAAES